jgi:hypothetical protein
MKKEDIDICTFDPDAPCDSCLNKGNISCKPDRNKAIVSHLLEFSFIIMAVFGVLVTSILLNSWILIVVYIIFIVLFFLVIQSRITCSHCPYYAEKRRFLHCTENHFTPKLWRYHPEPIKLWEKAGTVVGFTFLGSYPIIVDIYGLWIFSQGSVDFVSILGYFGIILGTLFALGAFYLTFFFLYCPHCLNFSCMFNKVPKKYVNEYLKRNPVIQKAWEDAGLYKKWIEIKNK